MHCHSPHGDIARIFRDLFPAHGMTERPEQTALAHRLLDAMLNNEIALCDAGTGIGKTYAVLAAVAVFSEFCRTDGRSFQPIIVSTSGIDLQEAIVKRYLPFISSMLEADGIISEPLRTVLRKGKANYICEERLLWRFRETGRGKNVKTHEALRKLLMNPGVTETDGLKPYERKRVCVPSECNCGRKSCRYYDYTERCNTECYPFQICNHNLLLADAMRKQSGHRSVLPAYGPLIIDEAHKLPEAARQMMGRALEAEELRDAVRILREQSLSGEAEELSGVSKALIARLEKPPDDAPFDSFIRLLTAPDRILKTVLSRRKHTMNAPTRGQLERLSATVDIFCAKMPENLYYLEENERGETVLCAAPPNFAEELDRLLWSAGKPVALLSGTLTAGGSFRPFREEAGLLENRRVRESVFPSPFDYERNCLLYFPKNAPRRKGGAIPLYYDELAKEMSSLITAAYGHTLILFTSYADMSSLTERLAKEKMRWPLFAMRNRDAHTLSEFESHPGGILLAGGSVWEGRDFPGDEVSLLIIPRLPFPRPDAFGEALKERYPTLRDYIQSVIVPAMQRKLEQGVGRSVRTETDTCVIAILDERAAPGSQYHKEVMDSLPEMRKTRNLGEVARFIKNVKLYRYFLEPPEM